jgi:hypothetical protein
VRPKIGKVGDYPWRQTVALKVASQAEIVPQVRRALGFSIGTAQMAANSNNSSWKNSADPRGPSCRYVARRARRVEPTSQILRILVTRRDSLSFHVVAFPQVCAEAQAPTLVALSLPAWRV